MKRFLAAAAVAMAVSLWSADRAEAQIVYGSNAFVPGGVVGTRSYYTPYSGATRTSYYSPYTGLSTRQYSYADAFGNQSVRSSVYNPWLNTGMVSGYSYAPPMIYPTYVGPYVTAPYVSRYGYVYRR